MSFVSICEDLATQTPLRNGVDSQELHLGDVDNNTSCLLVMLLVCRNVVVCRMKDVVASRP